MSIGMRIKNIRQNMNLGQKEFAQAIGVSQGRLSDIEKDKNNPSVDTIISISGFAGLSTDWILKGEESDKNISPDPELKKLVKAFNLLTKESWHALTKYVAFLLSNDHSHFLDAAINIAEKTKLAPETEFTKEEQSVYLPLLGTAAAGMPILSEELLEGFVPVPTDRIKKNNYLVKVKGESMIEAGIMDGDIVIINPQPVVETGEIALVKIDEEVTIKRFYQHGPEIRLKPANRTMDDIIVRDLDKLIILGKVIGFIPGEEANKKMRMHFNGAK